MKGQTSTEIVETNYAFPKIESISPNAAKTDGGVLIQIIGTEFGVKDENAKYKIVLTRGAPASSCFGIAPLDCHELVGFAGSSLVSGKEKIDFVAPESFGAPWNLRMVVSNAASNQSISTDFQPQDINLRLGYAIPEITSVDIKPSGFGGLNLLSIKGKNFCNQEKQGCGKILLCSKDASNATTEYCYAHSTEIANVSEP